MARAKIKTIRRRNRNIKKLEIIMPLILGLIIHWVFPSLTFWQILFILIIIGSAYDDKRKY